MRRRLNDERGISAVILVVSLLALMGAALISIDYGNTIQTRRHLITATDSTALDRARVENDRANALTGPGPIACPENDWQDYLLRNVGAQGLSGQQCNVYPNGSTGTGYVVVQALKESRTRFGGLFGIGNTNPLSISAAQYGFITAARGLRPMAFCNQNDHIQEWLSIVDPASDGGTEITTTEQAWYNTLPTLEPDDHPTTYVGAGVVHRMWFNRQSDDGACGGAPGNWGWMDFDCIPAIAGSCNNPNPDIQKWLSQGYSGLVTTWNTTNDNPSINPLGNNNGTCDIPDEINPASYGCVNGSDGMRLNSEGPELNTLISNGTHFHVPIFKAVSGSGNNTRFEIYGFLGVRLWGWYKDSTNGYFDMEFFELLNSGACCSPVPSVGAVRGIKLCGVDHDSAAPLSARCGQ
jgi:Flp pilus assembly protein TadG